MKPTGIHPNRLRGLSAFTAILLLFYPLVCPAGILQENEPTVHLSVDRENQRIDLEAFGTTRGQLLTALADILAVRWIGSIPRPEEPVTIQVSGMRLQQVLRRVLAHDSFFLMKTESEGRPAWEIRFLNGREEGGDPPLFLDSAILDELGRLGTEGELEDGAASLLEDTVFNGEEVRVYRMLARAAQHPSDRVRRGARALLEDLGPAWPSG